MGAQYFIQTLKSQVFLRIGIFQILERQNSVYTYDLTWLSNGKNTGLCNYKYKISPSTNDLSDLSHTKYSKKYRPKHYARSILLLISFQ